MFLSTCLEVVTRGAVFLKTTTIIQKEKYLSYTEDPYTAVHKMILETLEKHQKGTKTAESKKIQYNAIVIIKHKKKKHMICSFRKP